MKSRNIPIKVLIFLLIFSFASFSFSNERTMIKEAVMEEGMKIIVHSQNGELKIEAKEDGKRSFTWDYETYNAKLIPRKERWYGKLGLYHPQLRPPHKNVVHMVVEE